MKAGKYTTEFWLAMLAQVLSFLMTLGILNADSAAELQDLVAPAITSAAGIVSYIWSRTRVKQSQQ